MASFATITPEEYQRLIDNEKKIFDLTENFTSPEILNKYRHTDENIDKKLNRKKWRKKNMKI